MKYPDVSSKKDSEVLERLEMDTAELVDELDEMDDDGDM
jgi:hypothetical protein